jgi:hypothetical protein
LVGYTGSAGSGGGGSVSSLNNGAKTLFLSSSGVLGFPDDALTAPTGNNFSIRTDTGPAFYAIVTNPGTGFGTNINVFGTSATTGGSGTGLTVSYSLNGLGGVRGVEISNPGTGYQNGNVLTLSVGTGATITLISALTVNTWTFGRNGTTTFPNKLNFGISRVGDGVEGNAMILASSKLNIADTSSCAIIIPEKGTQANPFATDLRLMGGWPYGDPDEMPLQAPGGNVLIEASRGTVGGAVAIMGGSGWSAGGVFIESGSANSGGPSTGISNKGFGGQIGITGGFGYQEGGHVRITAGDVDGNVPAENGRGGDVDITAGDSGAADTNGGGFAGNVILRGGVSRTATARSGRVIIQTASFTNEGTSWYFMPNGTMTFPTDSAPTHSYGKVGDEQGMVAFADGYIYYCNAPYVDNSTDIWMRIALDGTSW